MRDSPAAADLTPDSFLTPFIIGVTGHMKLPAEKTETLREKLRVFFRWLQAGEEENFAGLGPGLGLKDTPIVLLSSMAPGVDQIAAGVAREAEFRFRVSPLPFPPEQYLRSNTFTKAGDAEKAALGAGKCRMCVIPSLNLVALRICDEDRDRFNDHTFLNHLLTPEKATAKANP